MKKDSWSMDKHPKMPKPKNDDGYFEKMSMVIFSAGLNWNVIDAKWPGIKKLFQNFSINKVSAMDERDIEKLLKNPAMIRSFAKINAIIKNAKVLVDVKKEFGSVSNYISKTKKVGEETLIKDLKKRFSFLGESTSVMFLYGCGEEMPKTTKKLRH